MLAFLSLIVLLLLAILAVAVWLAIDLRAIRSGLSATSRDLSRWLTGSPDWPPHFLDPHICGVHLPVGPGFGCFAVWVWRGGQWCLIREDLPDGVDPGPAPAWPGSHEGVRVRTWIPGRRP